MYYTNKVTNYKLGSYTDNPKIAKQFGFDVEIPDIEIVNGVAYVSGHAPHAPSMTYTEQRVAKYPPISDQLDMIYWDKINGTNTWSDTITAIKQQFPKQ